MEELADILRRNGFNTSELAPVEYGGEAVIYQLPISFAERTSNWLRLRALVEESGYWPVFTDCLEVINDYQCYTQAEPAANTLAQVTKLDALALLLELAREPAYPSAEQVIGYRRAELEGLRAEMGKDLVAYEEMKSDLDTALSNERLWADDRLTPEIERLGLHFPKFSHQWFPSIGYILLFPTVQWWEIPALIHFFPSSFGPEPTTHVVLWRWWATRFNVELVYLTSGGFSLRSQAFPATPADAITLAWEHAVYCSSEYFGYHYLDILGRAQHLYRGEGWQFGWMD